MRKICFQIVCMKFHCFVVDSESDLISFDNLTAAPLSFPRYHGNVTLTGVAIVISPLKQLTAGVPTEVLVMIDCNRSNQHSLANTHKRESIGIEGVQFCMLTTMAAETNDPV